MTPAEIFDVGTREAQKMVLAKVGKMVLAELPKTGDPRPLYRLMDQINQMINELGD